MRAVFFNTLIPIRFFRGWKERFWERFRWNSSSEKILVASLTPTYPSSTRWLWLVSKFHDFHFFQGELVFWETANNKCCLYYFSHISEPSTVIILFSNVSLQIYSSFSFLLMNFYMRTGTFYYDYLLLSYVFLFIISMTIGLQLRWTSKLY